jgi:hypothetical protein
VEPIRHYHLELKPLITKAYRMYVHQFQICRYKFDKENGALCTKRPFTDHEVPIDDSEQKLAISHPLHFSPKGRMKPGHLVVPHHETEDFLSRCWDTDIYWDFKTKYELLDQRANLNDMSRAARTSDWTKCQLGERSSTKDIARHGNG